MYKNSIDAIKKMYTQEGIKVFYRGMSASYLGIAESSLQFVLYERFKSIAREQSGKGRSLCTIKDES